MARQTVHDSFFLIKQIYMQHKYNIVSNLDRQICSSWMQANSESIILKGLPCVIPEVSIVSNIIVNSRKSAKTKTNDYATKRYEWRIVIETNFINKRYNYTEKWEQENISLVPE